MLPAPSGSKFEAGSPKALFETRISAGESMFDVSKDGRFLIPVPLEAPSRLTVVMNWPELLKP
jgi:hypothetical protein